MENNSANSANLVTIEGYIATDFKAPFLGQIQISKQTGLITKVSENISQQADYIYNKDCLIFAGFGDIHIHAREDQTEQQNYKEDYTTASKSALNGGCVHISAMPNTPKPLTTTEDLSWHRNKISEISDISSLVSILNYVGIDSNTEPLGEAGEHFYKLYFGKSVGDLSVIYADELDKILAKYKGHNISFHVEYEPIIQENKDGKTHANRRPTECVNKGLELLLPLIEKYNIKAKLCHWSVGGKSFEMIQKYREIGCHITLEVSPLHLLFDTKMTDENPELWTKIQMNPSIQTPKDRLELIEALKNGFIEFLATDHAPHTLEEKFSAFVKFKTEFPNLTNLEIANKIKQNNKKLYLETCQENGFSGAPWLDTFSLVCVELMQKYNFTTQDIARVAAKNPGDFVNPFLKKQFKNINFGNGFGQIKEGFRGDLTILNINKITILKKENLQTKVGWSPLENKEFSGCLEAVFMKGNLIKD